MDRSDIRDAITLFQYSNTARTSPRAAAVVRSLWQMEAANEIGPGRARPVSHQAGYHHGRRGYDLEFNPNFIDSIKKPERLGVLSLLLVHEATHAAVDFTPLLDELAARIMEIRYYRELSGPGVFNEGNDPPRPGKPFGIVHLAADRFPDYRDQSAALQRDQLIDYILTVPTYRKHRYIYPKWVVDHLTLWGGLANRLPATKGLYVRILARSIDRYYVVHILDILESINSRAEWDAMMAVEKNLPRLQLRLDDLTTDRRLSERIAALQKRWGVSLIETPQVPASRR
jgi:hypothetical protein